MSEHDEEKCLSCGQPRRLHSTHGVCRFTRELDKSQVWRDGLDRRWEWSDLNGWVVDGMATFGGHWPNEAGHPPFTPFDEQPVYIDWWGHAYTREDFAQLSEVWVCTEHKRFLPCRSCPKGPAGGSEWHSCDEADVQAVRDSGYCNDAEAAS